MLDLKIFEGIENITDADVREVVNETDVLGANEKVVGEVPMDLRRLIHLTAVIRQALTKKADETLRTIDDLNKLKSEVQFAGDQISAISTVFWWEVRARLGLGSATNFRVGAGWKIVQFPPKKRVAVEIIGPFSFADLAQDNDECDCPACKAVREMGDDMPTGWQMHHGQS